MARVPLTITSYQGVPEFRTPHWEQYLEFDVEFKQAASLIGILADKYELIDRNSSTPLIRRYVTMDEEEFEGVQLDQAVTDQFSLNMVLITNDRVRESTIRDDPALAVSSVSESNREIERYTPCSLYNFWLSFNINPRIPFGAVVRLVEDVVTFIGEAYHTFPEELVQHLNLTRSLEVDRRTWGQRSS